MIVLRSGWDIFRSQVGQQMISRVDCFILPPLRHRYTVVQDRIIGSENKAKEYCKPESSNHRESRLFSSAAGKATTGIERGFTTAP